MRNINWGLEMWNIKWGTYCLPTLEYWFTTSSAIEPFRKLPQNKQVIRNWQMNEALLNEEYELGFGNLKAL